MLFQVLQLLSAQHFQTFPLCETLTFPTILLLAFISILKHSHIHYMTKPLFTAYNYQFWYFQRGEVLSFVYTY